MDLNYNKLEKRYYANIQPTCIKHSLLAKLFIPTNIVEQSYVRNGQKRNYKKHGTFYS